MRTMQLPNVDDHDLRRIAATLRRRSSAVAHWPTTSNPVSARSRANNLAEEDAVFGEHYPHGISARTRVPPPPGLQTRKRPPSASTRSARPRIPEPPSVFAPPTPSSTTSTTSSPFLRVMSTFAPAARAYFATFARPSETR